MQLDLGAKVDHARLEDAGRILADQIIAFMHDLRIPNGLRELGWAATFLASPYARFISGHTLVVDGANWQRRSLTSPPVVTVRDQMGKAGFTP